MKRMCVCVCVRERERERFPPHPHPQVTERREGKATCFWVTGDSWEKKRGRK